MALVDDFHGGKQRKRQKKETSDVFDLDLD
jgi:hypothetical protein